MHGKLSSVLVALVVLASGVGIVGGVGDVAGVPGTTIGAQVDQSNATADAGVSLENGSETIEVERGGNASIRVAFEATDTATVFVMDEEFDYVLNATVTDGDADGTAVVVFDTDAVVERNATPVGTTANADSVTVNRETATHFEENASTPPLPAGSYAVALFAGNASGDDPVDEAKLVVSESDASATTTATRTTTEANEAMGASTATETTAVVSEPGPGIPGFGIGVALVALAIACIAIARR